MENYQSDYRMENQNRNQFSLYNNSGMKVFHSYNTNDQTRIDELFDDAGVLTQTKVFHVDSELRMNQEIVFKGTEKVLESIEDLYWDGRKDVFKADEQGRLKLQKQ
jgi:hypothetical protein